VVGEVLGDIEADGKLRLKAAGPDIPTAPLFTPTRSPGLRSGVAASPIMGEAGHFNLPLDGGGRREAPGGGEITDSED
jgi:hypothetical protein